jgi:thiamine biosynthesis protein ThiI
MNYYILRYGEIALKGKNRFNFEAKLKSNIIRYIKNKHSVKANITSVRGRFILETSTKVNLKSVFGLESYSLAKKFESFGDVKNFIINKFNFDSYNTFKVKTSRLNKKFPLKSPEVNAQLGELILNNYSKLKVDLHNPDLVLGLEIHKNAFYLYEKIVSCFGGLPLGSSNQIAIFAKNNERTILSCLELMKRGCKILLIGKNKLNSNLLKEFNNYQSLIEFENTDLDKLSVFAFANPQIYEEINTSELNNSFLNLFPLAFYSDKEVKEKLNEYEQI